MPRFMSSSASIASEMRPILSCVTWGEKPLTPHARARVECPCLCHTAYRRLCACGEWNRGEFFQSTQAGTCARTCGQSGTYLQRGFFVDDNWSFAQLPKFLREFFGVEQLFEIAFDLPQSCLGCFLEFRVSARVGQVCPNVTILQTHSAAYAQQQNKVKDDERVLLVDVTPAPSLQT